jgi:phosphoribosylglycinamide formyltransferase-1
MAAIARDCREKRISAQVRVVIADRPEAGGISVARELGLETEVVAWSSAPDRLAFERALGDCIDAHEPDLIVLAGFMRIFSPEFVARYAGRMINIHPSLLPKHRGLNTHRRVLEAGDTSHGASVHFVTAELDGGPVVIQSKVAVEPADTESTLAARVLLSEHIIYSRAIGWLADGRLVLREGRPFLDGKPLASAPVEDNSGSARN